MKQSRYRPRYKGVIKQIDDILPHDLSQKMENVVTQEIQRDFPYDVIESMIYLITDP